MVQTGGVMFSSWGTGGRAVLTSSHDGTPRRRGLRRALRATTKAIDRSLSDAYPSPDATLLVLASPRGVTVLDASTAEVKATIPIAGAATAQLSPDRQTVLAIDGAGHAGLYAVDGSRHT